MRLLLDTHVLLWVMTNDAALSLTARETISKATVVYASAVSIWEVSIKAALGKLKLDQDRFMKALPATGFEPLPVTWEHADAIHRLPVYHRDLFDRMLIAQAPHDQRAHPGQTNGEKYQVLRHHLASQI